MEIQIGIEDLVLLKIHPAVFIIFGLHSFLSSKGEPKKLYLQNYLPDQWLGPGSFNVAFLIRVFLRRVGYDLGPDVKVGGS